MNQDGIDSQDFRCRTYCWRGRLILFTVSKNTIIQDLPQSQSEDNPTIIQDLPQSENAQQCTDLTVKNVSASGFETDPSDYHPPSNAVDGDSNTWWSNQNKSSWIGLDFGEEKMICEVSVLWNKGDTRKYYFDIEVSKDGKDFVKVFEGTNNGDSSTPENYPLDEGKGHYLTLSFTKTSSKQGWVGIKEISVKGR
jgi:hypothetical protein